MDPKTFSGAVQTKTSIFTAITATLEVISLWLPVFSGAPITGELLTQTAGVISLWLAVVAARQAVAKSGQAS